MKAIASWHIRLLLCFCGPIYLLVCFPLLQWIIIFLIMKLEWHGKIIDIFFEFQARPLLAQVLEKGNFDGLVDVRLQNEYNSSEMACMVACAAACVRHSARRRPRMSQVILQSFEVTLSSHNRSIILVYILQFLFLFLQFFIYYFYNYFVFWVWSPIGSLLIVLFIKIPTLCKCIANGARLLLCKGVHASG